MALPSDDAKDKNGTNLTTVTYAANDVYNDEWQIFEDVTFEDVALNVGDTGTVNIKTDCPKNLNKVTDYTYTITSGASYISIDNNTEVINGINYANMISPGVATITATHKISEISNSFNVKVYAGFVVMTIFSSYSGSSSLSFETGHAFLTFYNNTKSNITVGYVTVAPGKEMSIGKFGVTAHEGIWYNKELYNMQTDEDYYDDLVSLTDTITLSNMEKINDDYIFDNDDYDALYDNCSTFAVTIWNAFTDMDLKRVAIDTPNDVKREIEANSNHEKGRSLQTTEYYGYFDTQSEKIICVWGTYDE